MIVFLRANLTAILATIVDFSFLTLSVEGFHFHYLAGTVLGAIAGAITNFMANRTWAFRVATGASFSVASQEQILRYAFVSGLSLGWTTLIVYLFTESLGLNYLWSKATAAVLVGWFWNYPLHKLFVFAHSDRR